MTDTKSDKSKKRLLLLRDFVVDDKERFVYSNDDYDLLFFSGGLKDKPKRYIQVWYKEKSKRYLRDESIMDWQILRYRYEIDKRNKDFWNRINKFYTDYFNE